MNQSGKERLSWGAGTSLPGTRAGRAGILEAVNCTETF